MMYVLLLPHMPTFFTTSLTQNTKYKMAALTAISFTPIAEKRDHESVLHSISIDWTRGIYLLRIRRNTLMQTHRYEYRKANRIQTQTDRHAHARASTHTHTHTHIHTKNKTNKQNRAELTDACDVQGGRCATDMVKDPHGVDPHPVQTGWQLCETDHLAELKERDQQNTKI